MARQQASFQVDLWSEPSIRETSLPLQWHGTVLHVASQERRTFTEIVDLIAFFMICCEHGTADAHDHLS